MKLLFLSGLQVFPPLSGGNLRSAALVTALGRHGLDVHVYSLVGRKPDYLARRRSGVQVWPDGIPEHVDRRPPGFLAQWGSYALSLPPLWITACLGAAARSPGEALLPARLRRELAWCDVVVADFPFLYPIFAAPSARGRIHVLSTHNVEHRLVRGALARGLVRAVELRAAQACHILVSCCADDGLYFSANAPVRHSVMVPNGVDLRRFAGIEAHRDAVRRGLGLAEDVKVVLFAGSKWGPNHEAFEFLREFARAHASLLAALRLHILAVGNVSPAPLRRSGFTATGPVEHVEPYFAAADAAINPVRSGAGTNVKMCEFIALRLPLLTTSFGARGLSFEGGETGLLFARDTLAPALSMLRRLFDEEPARLRAMAAEAYARNERVVDMGACVRPLVEAMERAGARRRRIGEPTPAGRRVLPV